MNDQIRVRVSNGSENIEVKTNARIHIQCVSIAVFVDRFSFDVFENKIRLAACRHARVDQFGDVTMRELAENSALPPEPFRGALCRQSEIEELDRRAPLEAAIAAFCEPDTAHAAPANRREQLVNADHLTR